MDRQSQTSVPANAGRIVMSRSPFVVRSNTSPETRFHSVILQSSKYAVASTVTTSAGNSVSRTTAEKTLALNPVSLEMQRSGSAESGDVPRALEKLKPSNPALSSWSMGSHPSEHSSAPPFTVTHTVPNGRHVRTGGLPTSQGPAASGVPPSSPPTPPTPGSPVHPANTNATAKIIRIANT